jgi:hypothetical protein
VCVCVGPDDMPELFNTSNFLFFGHNLVNLLCCFFSAYYFLVCSHLLNEGMV